MDLIRTLLSRCAAFFHRQKLDEDLDEELRTHIDFAIEENLRHGMTEEEARQTALREFGGMTQVKERYRTARALPWLDTLAQDIRFGGRMLVKNPGFTIVAVLTLALGIGGNTTIFSIVNGVLLNQLPFPQPDQLVGLHESKPNFSQGSISYQNFLDWQQDNRTFSAMALARGTAFSLTGKGDAEQVTAEFVSSDFFKVLEVNPISGRMFTREEERPGAGPVALISEGLWRRKFDATPDLLGKSMILDGRAFTIIGVVPAGFHLRTAGFSDSDVYAPIGQRINPALMDRAAGLGFHGIARLKPGVTLEQARADMEEVTRNLAVAFPVADKGAGASISPLKEQIVGYVRPILFVLLAAVGFVLLIACMNVAGLLLARSSARRREFAVRTALGASRMRIVRQLLTESILLGVAAGGLGLFMAAWGTRAALKFLPAALPRAEEIGLDLHVLIFTLTISLLVAVLFGMAPALRTSQAEPHTALKEGGRGATGTSHRALNTLVVVEMAVALLLLIGTGLMGRSLARLWSVDPGFDPRNALTFSLSLPPSMVNASPDRVRAAFRDLDDKLASTPHVQAVSQTWGAIPLGSDDEVLFWLDGQPRPATKNDMNWAVDYIVGPDYLKVMKTPLTRGRFFTAQDDEHSPLVAVIDDVLARTYFPGQDPVGKRVHLIDPERTAEIAGVVAHVKQWALDGDDTQLRAQLYLSTMQMPNDFIAMAPSGASVVVRYDGDLSTTFDAIRRTNRQMSSQQVIYGDQTMDDVISVSMATRRFAMILLAAFAALALLLACVGIYGVMAYLVSQRTQEIGIRMALGARRGDVLGLILWRGARLTLIGAAIGLGSAMALTRLMRSLLFDVSPTDPIVLGSVSLLLIAVALAACLIPARRAASIDPMRALRTE